jgi:hypothetical protein
VTASVRRARYRVLHRVGRRTLWVIVAALAGGVIGVAAGFWFGWRTGFDQGFEEAELFYTDQ